MIKQRIDQGGRIIRRIDSNGFVRVEGVVARVGIMEYYEGGKIVREFVPPEALFNQDSMESLSGSPVTLQHPPELVNSANYAQYSQGSVATTRQDGNNLIANLTIVGSEAINAVESGVDELSPGYAVELDETPGEWNGQRYDRKQTRRFYNHQAIVDAARGGRECRLNFDCAIAVIPENNDVAKVKLPNGETVDLSAENAASSIEAAFGEQTARLDSFRGKIIEITAARNDEALRLDAKATDEQVVAGAVKLVAHLDSENDKLQAKVDELEEQKKKEGEDDEDEEKQRKDAASVAALLSVIEDGKKLKPELTHLDSAGKLKSRREIMVEALTGAKVNFDATGKSDDYIASRFDSAIENIKDESLRKQRDGFNVDSIFSGESSQDKFNKKFYEGKA